MLSRLQRLAASELEDSARPSNSAVQAGWICVSLGMLVAWWLPLGHGFFSLAIIMSVVAMATHQVKSGLLLLATAFVGMLLCWAVFAAAFTALLFGAAHRANGLPLTPTVRSPAAGLTNTASGPFQATLRSAPDTASGALSADTGRPLFMDDLMRMLRSGYRDDKIIAEASRRPLATSISPMQAEMLRTEGAGDRLIGYLQDRHPYHPTPAYASARGTTAATAFPAVGVIPGVAHAEGIDYAARDRQIQTLKTQIDALDEQMRCVRTNPKDSRYLYHYAGRSNGIDQQKLDAYLNDLDRQRNDLRRQKWQLEGR